MKHNQTVKLQDSSATEQRDTSVWQQICMRVQVRDGFRCRICNGSQNFSYHIRLDETQGFTPNDVLTLCEKCHSLAQQRKQKHTQNKRSHVLRLVCYASLLVGIIAIVMTLSFLLSLPLFLLTLAGIYATLLLEVLHKRWF